MTNQEQSHHNPNAGITDIIGSMLGLASAGTTFTLRQMRNALGVFTDSQAVLNDFRNSLDNLSSAMTKSLQEPAADSASAPQQAVTAFTGRKPGWSLFGFSSKRDSG